MLVLRMLPHENLRAPIDHHQLSAMVQKTNALRTALRRREPRCRICRDDAVRIQVDRLLDWVGIPIMMGNNKFHVVTYADILRDLEPLNGRRTPKDRITYNSLWNHAKRHHDLDGLLDHWGRRVEKEFEDILGIPARCSAESASSPGTSQVRRNGNPIQTLFEMMLDQTSMKLDRG
jgi:hypothetical protein